MTRLDVPQQPDEEPPAVSVSHPDPAALTPWVPGQRRKEEPARRGRKAEPVSSNAGPCHQAWLASLRGRFTDSGYTLDELADLTGFSKTRLSVLLRGEESYPSWNLTYCVIRALGIPVTPGRRLWSVGAQEAKKTPAWIERRIHEVRPLDPETPPLALKALREAMRDPYTRYTRALLQSQRADWLVLETFDLLWLDWDTATSSPDVRRYAWELLRGRVWRRALRNTEGQLDLRQAAFSTVGQSRIEDPEDCFAEISEISAFFELLGHLQPDQIDIVVLRYLCGLGTGDLPNVVGLSPAAVHTLDHHARGALQRLHHRHDDPGATAP
ncbi:XRE family transcriptional regulator [Streptomyces microflavus]|uniref:XRE family transcriptional regulator n=1 Tax=Streptomyces microflavus TaxID=1919 RepID=UPI002E332F9E|nr:XRE family transcriptional regulator [Streptomyces microflavus]